MCDWGSFISKYSKLLSIWIYHSFDFTSRFLFKKIIWESSFCSACLHFFFLSRFWAVEWNLGQIIYPLIIKTNAPLMHPQSSFPVNLFLWPHPSHMDLVAVSLQIQHPFSCNLFLFCWKVWWRRNDHVGTNPSTSGTADAFGESAVCWFIFPNLAISPC